MNDEDFERLLTRLGEGHRALISDAVRQADKAVDLARLKTRSGAADPRRIVRPPISFWRPKMRFVTGELARMAATVALAAGLTFWLMSARLSHSNRSQSEVGAVWIPRGSASANMASHRC